MAISSLDTLPPKSRLAAPRSSKSRRSANYVLQILLKFGIPVLFRMFQVDHVARIVAGTWLYKFPI
jgi:hypothetical protein